MEKRIVISGLIKDIRTKKDEARRLQNEKGSSYYSAIEEIRSLESSLYQLLDYNEDSDDSKENAFINSIKAYSGVKKISETDQSIINYMRQSAGEDGGFLVPSDIQAQVKKARQDGTNLEEFVNVEPVRNSNGTKIYEIGAENEPFETVLEGDDIPETDPECLKEVKYKIKKNAGIVKVTNELFADTNKAILKWLKTWLAKKSRAGRNKAIINKINEMTEGKEVKVNSTEDLKTIFNKSLDAIYSSEAIVLTNMSGYDFLDGLYDLDGYKILESDSANREKLLFGLYPVKRVSDKMLKNEETFESEVVVSRKYPIICGSLKEAITLFDREKLTVDLSQQGSAFYTDYTKIKGRDSFDVQEVDENAVIKAYAEVVV